MSLLLAYDEFLAQPRERLSHGGLGVATVSNACPRTVWHEIWKGTKPMFDVASRRKMRSGILYEDDLDAAVKAKYGDSVRGREVCIFHTDGIGRGRIDILPADEFDACPTKYAGRDDLVGHPDFVIDGADVPLWECKASDKSFGRWAKRRPNFGLPADANELRSDSKQYVLQGAAYAHAYGFDKFGIHLQDSASRQVGEYVFNTEEEWPAFEARWAMMREQCLNPDQEAEANPPPWTMSASKGSYLCKQCPVTTCKSNANFKFEKAS